MDRIYHTWDKWECYPAGFYEANPPDDMTREDCEEAYRTLLSDVPEFRHVLSLVISEWKHSCEHYLTNENYNRIAWLGQAAVCYKFGVSSKFSGAFHTMTPEQQHAANLAALDTLNEWLAWHNEEPLTLESAKRKTQMNLY